VTEERYADCFVRHTAHSTSLKSTASEHFKLTEITS